MTNTLDLKHRQTLGKQLSLEKLLHKQGFGSRKLCRIMIINEEITVNGKVCDDPNALIELNNLHYTVKNEPWEYREHSYLMMNKPSNYECSHKTLHHPSIYSLLPFPLVERGVQCIGRLDEDTTGLILISDDGQFIHRMSSPKHKVPKVYEVTCKHAVSNEQIKHILKGVQLVDEDPPIAALACERLSENIITMTLAEGKYHQVKRMVATISNRVERLQRIQIGGLSLPKDLKMGQWRWLTPTDIEALHAFTAAQNHLAYND